MIKYKATWEELAYFKYLFSGSCRDVNWVHEQSWHFSSWKEHSRPQLCQWISVKHSNCSEEFPHSPISSSVASVALLFMFGQLLDNSELELLISAILNTPTARSTWFFPTCLSSTSVWVLLWMLCAAFRQLGMVWRGHRKNVGRLKGFTQRITWRLLTSHWKDLNPQVFGHRIYDFNLELIGSKSSTYYVCLIMPQKSFASKGSRTC